MSYFAVIQVMEFGKITKEKLEEFGSLAEAQARFPEPAWKCWGKRVDGMSPMVAHDKGFIEYYALNDSSVGVYTRNVQAYLMEPESAYIKRAHAVSGELRILGY